MIDRNKTFREIELESWTGLANEYDDQFSIISRQAIDPVLDSLEPLAGRRHLDIACGTGHLVAAAVERGAISQGIDFTETMVAVARRNYPLARFEVGDAARIPYPDETFDVVSCTFGLSHMEDPYAVVAEAYRVMKPGGRFAFTLWYGPEDGNEFQAIVKEAFSLYISNPVALPETWTQLRYADEAGCRAMTARAGFAVSRFQQLPIVWRTLSVENVIGLFEHYSIRTRIILDEQPLEVKQQILDYVRKKTRNLLVDGTIVLAWPALLTVVHKPEHWGVR